MLVTVPTGLVVWDKTLAGAECGIERSVGIVAGQGKALGGLWAHLVGADPAADEELVVGGDEQGRGAFLCVGLHGDAEVGRDLSVGTEGGIGRAVGVVTR